MIEIGSVVWGVKDVGRAVRFWTEVLGYSLKYPMSEDWAILIPEEGKEGIQLSIDLITCPKARRHHMDLFSDDMEKEVARLKSIGAEEMEWNYPEDADFTVLKDPDGNPFCVVQLP